MKRRLFKTFLFTLVFAALFALSAAAADFASGSGTADDPYLVSTAAELNAVRNNLSAHYKMTADIDLSSYTNWTPIGQSGAAFSGTFDGDGHVIKNLTVNISGGTALEDVTAGLFGLASANSTIRGVVVQDCSIRVVTTVSCDSDVGGIVGRALGKVEDCGVTGTIYESNSYYSGTVDIVGGVVGYMGSNATVQRCWNGAKVTAYSADGQGRQYVGGIAGSQNGGYLYDCFNFGTLTSDSFYNVPYVGGIAGTTHGTLQRCYNVGALDGGCSTMYDSVYLGGIAGGATQLGRVSNCCFLKASNCTVGVKDVNASAQVSATMVDTDAAMRLQSTYSGFNFTTVWTMEGNADYLYPELQSIAPIYKAKIVSLTVTPKTEEYFVGDTLTHGDLTIVALYDNGAQVSPGTGKYTLSYDFSTPGAKTVTVSYDGLTATCTVTVKEQLYAGGRGTKADPYLISTKEHLSNVRENLSAYYEMTADIDLGSTAWTPIGSKSAPFTGSFNGKGHSITALKITDTSTASARLGLFAQTNGATVQNLTVRTDLSLTVSNYASTASADTAYIGGIAGYAYNTGFNNCTVSGRVEGDLYYSNATATLYAGGITGYAENCAFVRCASSAAIRSEATSGNKTSYAYAGGITGYLKSGSASLCRNSADLTAFAYDFAYAGGIAGHVMGTSSSQAPVQRCYNTGALTATAATGSLDNSYTGGIAGSANFGAFTDCFNIGSVSGSGASASTGGIVGRLNGSGHTVTRCYHAGTVSGGSSGAIVGFYNYSDNTFLTNYYLIGSASQAFGYGTLSNDEETAVKLSASRMCLQSSFPALDFAATWTMAGSTNYFYPELQDMDMVFTKALRSITVTAVKTSYPLNGTVAAADLTAEALYNNGETVILPLSDCTLTYDFSVLGETDITVSYNGLSDFCTVSVVNPDFAGGRGTAEDPYLISTKAQLDCVRKNLSAHYKMTADIVFTEADFAEGGDFYNDGTGWQPIGDSSTPFTGTFDGDGKTITGLFISYSVPRGNEYFGGFFGFINGSTIENLGMINSNINITAVNDEIYVGAIAGYGNDVIINNCYNTGNIYGPYITGGIIGKSSGSITNSYNTGIIRGGGCALGGIAGSGRDTIFSKCFNTGDIVANVSGPSCAVGGIVGSAASPSSIDNCYNTGDVTGNILYEPDAYMSTAGGIVGYVGGNRYYDSYITNCYNIGIVQNAKSIGAIVGGCDYANRTTITNCYYLTNNAVGIGQDIGTITDTATALTLAQMQSADSFEGFDFDSVWTMGGNADYPFPELKGLPMVWDPTLYGDVNGDGAVTAYDASLVLQYNVGLIDLAAEQLLAADTNGDGAVTAYDASLILQLNVGLIESFPAEKK